MDGLFRWFPFFCWDKSDDNIMLIQKNLGKKNHHIFVDIFFLKKLQRVEVQTQVGKNGDFSEVPFFFKIDLCFIILGNLNHKSPWI